jgi:hypothetical protein
MTSKTLPAEWAELRDIAALLEQGDSLEEIIAAIVGTRRAFPAPPAASSETPVAILGRFLAALLSPMAWERFGIGVGNTSRRACAMLPTADRPSPDRRPRR